MKKNQADIETTKLGNKVQTDKKRKTKSKKEGTELTAEPDGKKRDYKEIVRFIIGLILLVVSLLLFISFTSFLISGKEDMVLLEQGVIEKYSNWTGCIGARCANYFINRCFGFSAFFIPVLLLAIAMKLTRAYKIRMWKWILNCIILVIWLSLACSFFLQTAFDSVESLGFINPGGDHGRFVSTWLSLRIGKIGTFLILAFTAICYLVYVSSETIQIVRKLLNPFGYIKSKIPVKTKTEENKESEDAENTPITPVEEAHIEAPAPTIDFSIPSTEGDETNAEIAPNEESNKEIEVLEKDEEDTPSVDLSIIKTEEEEVASTNGVGALEPYDPKLDLENYRYPTLELLDKHNNSEVAVDMEEQNKNKDRIVEVLRNFGIEISSITATVGPTITLYEITPDKGMRIARIKNLEDDIALSLRALGIRIIAPIPGKGTIGIEVPNARPCMVSMESILNSKKFSETDYELPIALGKTITNEVFMVDLAKMPHLLVAGATGQGKSVGLNAIITSLLYKKHPAELKLVMVDPKKVEFSIYSPIENHFLAQVADSGDEPIITDVQKVVATLKSLCCEMDTRYDLLKKARARNLKEYNAKFKNRQLNPNNGHRFMPYIVVIIDEFGDLIMTAGKEIELPIARIAQLARAVGIHMIIATQRPTTNIITGTIKANFPARMAFKVSSMIDSRTILDRPGANQLIGRGDMLFLSGSEPVRVQCAFVDTPEVERITAYIAKQQSYTGPFELPRVELESEDGGGAGDVDMTHLDPMFEEAARLIVATQQGSTSMIQRKFAIGYNRAGRLMDQLEKAGIVGAAQGSKPREVLCIDDNDLEMKLNNLR